MQPLHLGKSFEVKVEPLECPLPGASHTLLGDNTSRSSEALVAVINAAILPELLQRIPEMQQSSGDEGLLE